jgi:hypothetical protein
MGHGPRQRKKAILIHGRPRSLEIREEQERLIRGDESRSGLNNGVVGRIRLSENIKSGESEIDVRGWK